MTKQQQKQAIKKQVDARLAVTVRHLDRLIDSIQTLDGLIDDYKALGLAPGESPFRSKKYQRAIKNLSLLQAWRKTYTD